MRWVVLAVLGWAALSYFDGVGQNPAPLHVLPAASLEDCHCYIEPNHGLYR